MPSHAGRCTFHNDLGLWRNVKGRWRHWLDPDQKLAYVQVAVIDRDAARRTKELIEQLKRQGPKGLVFDRRDSPGRLATAWQDTRTSLRSPFIWVQWKR